MSKRAWCVVAWLTWQAGLVHAATEAQDFTIGKGGGTLDHPPSEIATPASGIDWHGGPVMHGAPNIYFIWYGNWDGNTAVPILTEFVSNLGGSPYYNINTGYFDNGGNISNAANFAGALFDRYSRGDALSDGDVSSIVFAAILAGRLPADNDGVYFVLTSADVDISSGFCRSYCGWHSWFFTIVPRFAYIKFAVVGNADRCPSACAAQSTSSPNDNIGADAMASVIAHEFEETTSDPLLNAWYDSANNENADKCAWTFGAEYRAPNGSRANMHLGARDYLIQQNWVNAGGGYCALDFPYWPLVFQRGDARRFTSTGDWSPYNYKAECGGPEPMVGLSKFTDARWAHAALCRSDDGARYPHSACRTVDFSSGDNRGTLITGDWDFGFYKGECGVNEYAAGISQSTDGRTQAILCCAGAVGHNACATQIVDPGDSRETLRSGEWDFLFYKAECGDGRYVGGASRDQYSGAPHTLLCCSP